MTVGFHTLIAPVFEIHTFFTFPIIFSDVSDFMILAMEKREDSSVTTITYDPSGNGSGSIDDFIGLYVAVEKLLCPNMFHIL